MRQFLTSQDVRDYKRLGYTTITVPPGTAITSVAEEEAHLLGITIVVSSVDGCARGDGTGQVEILTLPGAGGARPGARGAGPGAVGSAPPPSTAVARTTFDLLVHGGNVVIPGGGIMRADIGIAGGRVAALGELKGADTRERVDASGRYVLPGIVDPHVHLGIFAPFDVDVRTETRSAVLGGVTTVGVFVGSRESYLNVLPRLEESALEHSSADVFPHLCLFTDAHRTELPRYAHDLGVTSFKLYMAGVPGLIDPVDDAFMVDTFERLRFLGGKAVVCIHAENQSIVDLAVSRLQAGGPEADLARWSQSHPGLAEEEAVSRAALLAARTGVSAYFVHLNTIPGLAALRRARAERLTACRGQAPGTSSGWQPAIFAETTSAYLTVTSDAPLGAIAKMTPPFRDRATVDELWEAVSDGTIDTLGTDNVTLTLAEKNAGLGVWGATPGFPALATHLPVMLDEGVGRRGLPLLRLAELMSRNPARIFGLYPRKGTLLPGSDADLVVVDLNSTRRVDPQQLGSRADFSLYQGQLLKGWPIMTIKGGRVVVRDGQFVQTGRVVAQWLRRPT